MGKERGPSIHDLDGFIQIVRMEAKALLYVLYNDHRQEIDVLTLFPTLCGLDEDTSSQVDYFVIMYRTCMRHDQSVAEP